MSLPNPDALRAAALRLPRLPSAPVASGPVAVAVSGGADSVYLLCALWADEALRPRLRVLHFDHRVRGEASAEDARFVAALCATLAVPCVVGVRAGQGMASEAELRAGRDAFFAQQRASLGFEILCTAHHLDDVVENMLLRLARGAGLAGLAAPRVIQTFHDGHRRWRPLIQAGLDKPALLAGLRAAGIPWREDATNLLPIAARNRVRAWLAAGGVGGTVDVAALHAAAGEGDTEHFWPVVAAAGGVDLRRAAELGVDHDEGGIEQAAFVEVADEGGVGLVEIGHLGAVGALDIVVVIPAAVGERDETHAGFDEAAGDQKMLLVARGTVAVVLRKTFAVTLADFGVLFADVESFGQLAGGEDSKGLLREGVEAVELAHDLGRGQVVVVGECQRGGIGGQLCSSRQSRQ